VKEISIPPEAEEWAMRSPLSAHGLEGALLPRFEAPCAEAATVGSPEEAALVARACAGDQEAFGVLVRHHQRQVYTLALRMLHDGEEASEATQEVFLHAWQGLRGFRGEARFATWLYRITYNHCLKATQCWRRDSAARAALLEESVRKHSEASIVSAHYAQAAERELRETVRDEMASLPPKYRAVLVLRHLQEFTYEEMAEIMRVPIGTVKTQLFRARALLKERLEGISRGGAEGITGITGGIAQGLARAGELRAGLRNILERKRDGMRKGED
jgi:RNA polymerase sigma-70 factor (ECF subfamily)